MPRVIDESDSLANFVANPGQYLDHVMRQGGILRLSADGTAGVVVLDAALYRRLLERLDRLDTIAKVREGMLDAARGETVDAREALAEIARECQLPSAAEK